MSGHSHDHHGSKNHDHKSGDSKHGHSKRRGQGTGYKFDPSRLEKLRDPERLKTQNPDAIWNVLAESPIHTLVDLGVGIGFFAIPFARKIPEGKIYGCDINPDMLEYLRAAMKQEQVGNIEPVLSGEVEVPLPDATADVVLMVNLHHELDFRDRTLEECWRLLVDGGRVAVIDWKPMETEKGPPLHVRISPSQVGEEMLAAGFVEVVEHNLFPQHYMVVGRKGPL